MLFQDYKNKLERRNKRIVALWKLRYVFLAILLLLIAASVLLGVAGNVVGSNGQSSFTYGDKLQFEAKAIFGDVHWQYRANGGNWTENAPVHVGKYEARAVSHGLAGKPKFGKTLPFEIVPAPLTVKVTDSELSFEDTPQYAAYNLKFGDNVCVEEFEMDYSDGTVVATPVKQTVKVTDKQGKDVTANYSVSVQSKTIICNPIAALGRTGSQQWTYDGQPHATDSAEAFGLLEGHTLQNVVTACITDVGTAQNAVTDYKIFDEDGNDVTVHYVMTWQTGTLTIVPRSINVVTGSAEFVYDGTGHVYEQAEVQSGFLPTHTPTFGNWTVAVNAGSVDNKPARFGVTDDSGKDVSANYLPNYICGKLTVAKRVFDVQTGDAVFVYDGTAKKHLQFDILPVSNVNEGLLQGHTVTASASNGVTNITDRNNQIAFADNEQTYTVVDADGKDVSANYEPRGKWGQIRVKQPIRVRVYAVSKYYDGTPLVYSANDWLVDSVPAGVEASWIDVELKGSLTDVGVLSLSALRNNSVVTVKDDNGKNLLDDANDPNRVDFVGTPLTVYARPLTVTSISVSQRKDSEPLSGNVPNAAWVSVGSLLEGHSVQFTVTGVLALDAQSAPNTVSARVIDGGGADVSRFYSITYSFGTLRWI